MRFLNRHGTRPLVIAVIVAFALLVAVVARSTLQGPAVLTLEEKVLRDYAGVYRWQEGGFVYLQLWDEFTGFGKPKQLVAFDESGDIRTLYATDRDRFFSGPSAAISSSIESRIAFQRDSSGRLTGFTWTREGANSRSAQRVDIETHEEVRFSSGDIRIAGTLIRPRTARRLPAVILVHGSGPEDREYVLPAARFLVRRGMAVLGYDKRGVGGSTGNWNDASFDDLAADVVAAFNYLLTRSDIEPSSIGLLGVSQAGWVMPLAAVRAPDIAFLISVSGAAVTPAETTIDQARNEMRAGGMPAARVEQIIALMKLQYEFGRTGEGWEAYAAARQAMAARMGGPPPATFPGTPDDPRWGAIRRTYFFDPTSTLRQLKTPVLAIFGELDNNILPEKNRAAWEVALKAGAHPDYTLTIVPKANHLQLEAVVGNNAEMPSLKRYVPEYFATIRQWLAKRVGGFDGAVTTVDPK